MATKAKTTEGQPPSEDPLDVYLQVAHEGDPDAVTPSKQFWHAALSEGGHPTTLYGKSQKELAARGD